jgi:predicted nuclease of predicted toxin-antitoxin system
VGNAQAGDGEIMTWARERGFVVMTNDLDLPQILAHTGDVAPSVILLRGEPLIPENRSEDL